MVSTSFTTEFATERAYFTDVYVFLVFWIASIRSKFPFLFGHSVACMTTWNHWDFFIAVSRWPPRKSNRPFAWCGPFFHVSSRLSTKHWRMELQILKALPSTMIMRSACLLYMLCILESGFTTFGKDLTSLTSPIWIFVFLQRSLRLQVRLRIASTGGLLSWRKTRYRI